MKKIGIVMLATNAYFVLGIRFIKRFMLHYKGNSDIKFYFFSDINPKDYLPDNINVEYFHTTNSSWVEGVNLKFISILSLEKTDCDYLYFFDADTNIKRDFTEKWFIGEMVGGQHFGDQDWMKETKGYDRHSKSSAYVPYDTTLPQMYFYGAFFGGRTENMFKLCRKIREMQLENKKINYEPGVNDESYLNHYYHYNPPTKVVMCPDFAFIISDKGSLGETRRMDLNVTQLKNDLKKYKNNNIDIISAKVVLES